jgi:hypothetical protein
MAEIGYYSYKRRDWKVFPNKLNPFWRDFLLNLSEMLAIKDEEEKYIINIMSQPIWFRFNIKRNDNFFYY